MADLPEMTILDVTSPSAAFARQSWMEARVERVLLSQMRLFLADVETMAAREGLYLSAASVTDSWTGFTTARALEHAGLPTDVAEYVSESLATSPVPDDAYGTVMAVFTASNEGQWSAQLSRDVLALALSMDSPPQVATVTAAAPSRDSKRGKAMSAAFDTALGGSGRISWQAAMKRDARTAVTGLDGLRATAEMRQQGAEMKMWITRRDERVRSTHSAADGQMVPVDQPFIVGGYPMMHPGDRSAPSRETVNCRCIMTAPDLVVQPSPEVADLAIDLEQMEAEAARLDAEVQVARTEMNRVEREARARNLDLGYHQLRDLPEVASADAAFKEINALRNEKYVEIKKKRAALTRAKKKALPGQEVGGPKAPRVGTPARVPAERTPPPVVTRSKTQALDDAKRAADAGDKTARNRAIIEAQAAGATVRETAQRLGMSDAGVRRLLPAGTTTTAAKTQKFVPKNSHSITNPRVANYNGRVMRTTEEDATTDQNVKQYVNGMSPAHHRLLAKHFEGKANGGVYLGGHDHSIVDLDHQGHLHDVAPRGWPPGKTFRNVGGAYDPANRVLSVGTHRMSGSVSTSIHEGSHALDHAFATQGVSGTSLKMKPTEKVTDTKVYRERTDLALAEGAGGKPYYNAKGNPNGYHSEVFAEGAAAIQMARFTGANAERAVMESLGMHGVAGRGYSRWFISVWDELEAAIP